MGDLESLTGMPRSLNLGCGLDKRAGCLNVDLRPQVSPDLVWDLAQRPYPLPRSWFENIYALDVIEHLDDIQAFMEEVHALLAAGGVIEITTPHFSSANSFTDPTHRHHLGYFSLDYFTEASPWAFHSVRFEIVERLIAFHPGRITRIVAALAKRWPRLYERRFAWIWPAWFLTFRLRAVQ